MAEADLPSSFCPSPMNYFITGTDTEVGKTFFTALLTRASRRAGFDTVALKPLCCGPRDDVETLHRSNGGELTEDEINPLWFHTPAAPLLAARKEGREIPFDHLSAWFRHWRSTRNSLLVEGAGGWLVPLSKNETGADLARLFGLPVVVVVANRLGCLNHALLTVESIRQHGLTCAGLVLNSLHDQADEVTRTNKNLLEEICDVPLLFDVRLGQTDLELAVA